MHSIKYNIHHSKSGRQRLTLCDNIIVYIIHGTLRIYNDELRHLQQEKIFILRAGYYQVEYLTNDNYPYEEIVIHLSHASLRNIINKMPHRDMVQSEYQQISHKNILTNHIISLYFQEIRNYILLKIFDYCEPMEGIKINELLNLILFEPSSSIAQNLLQLIDNSKNEFVEHIQTSLFRNVTIDKLATECDMSLSTFKHTFHKYFHCAPHHWFVTHRLNTVCTLLKYTCDPIKTIASECGFSTPSHMIRLFHSHYGITPTQYRATINKHNVILNNTDTLLK